jgi:folate-binding protein YgfZ
MAERLIVGARALGGRAVGWQALEIARIEAGIPRFGVDMDATNFPQEAGIEARAVSYTKGCYIGQEVLNRIHTMGHVNRQLRGLRVESGAAELPAKGDKLYLGEKEVGFVTSATLSPALGAIALAYLTSAAHTPGTQALVRSAGKELPARVTELPFVRA